MATKPTTSKNYRSAEHGRYVTKRYAEKHPDKTVAERRDPPPAPKKR